MAFVLVLAFLNYTGLDIVGHAPVVLGVFSMIPFVLMFFFAIPKVKPRRRISLGEKGVKKDWNLYFNSGTSTSGITSAHWPEKWTIHRRPFPGQSPEVENG